MLDVGEFHNKSCHEGMNGQDKGAGSFDFSRDELQPGYPTSKRLHAKKVQRASTKIKPAAAKFSLPQKQLLVSVRALLRRQGHGRAVDERTHHCTRRSTGRLRSLTTNSNSPPIACT